MALISANLTVVSQNAAYGPRVAELTIADNASKWIALAVADPMGVQQRFLEVARDTLGIGEMVPIPVSPLTISCLTRIEANVRRQ
jgi:hypothetical protein